MTQTGLMNLGMFVAGVGDSFVTSANAGNAYKLAVRTGNVPIASVVGSGVDTGFLDYTFVAWELTVEPRRRFRFRIRNQDCFLVNSEELCARRLAEDVFYILAVDSNIQSGVLAFALVPRETTA